MAKTGIVLLAYGSPENLDDMGAFLTAIRGKPFPDPVVQQFRDRYEQTGGPSPLNQITREQGQAIAKFLKKNGHEIPVFVGMAYCEPFIRSAVEHAHQQGVEHLLGVVMAPHQSKLSTGKYLKFFHDACESVCPNVKTSAIDHWFHLDGVQAFFRKEIQTLLDQLGENTPVLFTAHALPERMLEEKDPYFYQVKKNSHELAKQLRLHEDQWDQVWQSAGYGKEPWFQPSAEDWITSIPEIQIPQFKNLIIAPIGFACDHIEILYDIDIQLKEHAAKKNITIHRTASLNTDPLFIEALGKHIIEHLHEA